MDETCKAVLRAASELLVAEGPAALSNRKIASAAGCTTMAIYSRFGSKAGVLEALYREGFETLAAAQASVEPTDDPSEELLRLCATFRATAHEYAGHYALMFGGVPDFEPTDAAREQAMHTFVHLEQAVARFLDARSRTEDARDLASSVFAACHGYVSLEASGYLPPGIEPDASFERFIGRVLGEA